LLIIIVFFPLLFHVLFTGLDTALNKVVVNKDTVANNKGYFDESGHLIHKLEEKYERLEDSMRKQLDSQLDHYERRLFEALQHRNTPSIRIGQLESDDENEEIPYEKPVKPVKSRENKSSERKVSSSNSDGNLLNETILSEIQKLKELQEQLLLKESSANIPIAKDIVKDVNSVPTPQSSKSTVNEATFNSGGNKFQSLKVMF
jgi:hypothetical protein